VRTLANWPFPPHTQTHTHTHDFTDTPSGKLLCVLASTAILGSESRGTHDHILLSHDCHVGRLNCCWPRQGSKPWVRVPLGPMTIFLFIPRFFVFWNQFSTSPVVWVGYSQYRLTDSYTVATTVILGYESPYFTVWRLEEPSANSSLSSPSSSQSYFTTVGLLPISSSWRQAPWDSRLVIFFNWQLAVIVLM
jgi:hypothetical protein